MIATDESRIHGIQTRWANDGAEVSYVYPGPLQVVGATVRADAGVERVLVLGISTADPDSQDLRDERLWRGAPGIDPATQIWARHVLAAEATRESQVYEHDGQVVYVAARLPSRERELELLRGGFTPALATWRAPYTADAIALATRTLNTPDSAAPTASAGSIPPDLRDGADHAARAEHAWMRWVARVDNRVLKLGDRIYRFQRPPERDGARLIVRYRGSDAVLHLTFDVARHPLIYDVTIASGEHDEKLREHTIPGVAWEDFGALITEIGRIVASKPAATVVGAPRSGEEMEGEYRRADVWVSALASVLVDLDLPESLPLYPLAQRLTRAALALVDEQVAQHGADYIESLRRPGPTQVARLARLEQDLFVALAEAQSFGGLTQVVRHVLGLVDGSIHRPPAGTASETFSRTWTAPDSLTLRGLTFKLRRNHVLFETGSIELRYRAQVSPDVHATALTLTVGLPDKRGTCEVGVRLRGPGIGEQAGLWKLPVPQLGKLTGAAIVKQLRLTAPPPPGEAEVDPWEDILVAEFNARSEAGPQLRLERRLGSGSRIFVAFLAGSRPEQIVARIDINAAIEVESIQPLQLNADQQAALRRGLEVALEVTRARAINEDEAEDYAAARKKALPTPPRPTIIDRLQQQLAGQREAAALLQMRNEARTDLSVAARHVAAMAAPVGPSPSETAEWLDEQELPRSAALLSSYIFTPSVPLDVFLADLSESLDNEMGVRPVELLSGDRLELPGDTVRTDGARQYVLEAAGTSIRPHTITVIETVKPMVVIDAGKLTRGPLRSGEARIYINGRFSEAVISDVRERYHGLVQSFIQAPAQLDDMRQLIVIAAVLVDAPRCQGTAKANALRALEAARAHYDGARTELARGRDARALDRLREALRAVVQVAHDSAESCAAGQTALLTIAAEPANQPSV
jgi:hypothetical protein